MINLKKVDTNNIWKIVNLSVNTDQLDFVATNNDSFIEAYATILSGGVALPFGIYDDDTLVGFIMFGYGTTGDEDEPKIADKNYCIWRFMIDKKYQSKGFGRKAVQESVKFLRSEPCGKAEYCWLSYEPENVRAKALYNSIGFFENGEKCGDEIVAILPLYD